MLSQTVLGCCRGVPTCHAVELSSSLWSPKPSPPLSLPAFPHKDKSGLGSTVLPSSKNQRVPFPMGSNLVLKAVF